MNSWQGKKDPESRIALAALNYLLLLLILTCVLCSRLKCRWLCLPQPVPCSFHDWNLRLPSTACAPSLLLPCASPSFAVF
ncbi:hypothetical protein BT63DRAFT_209510 [Microthyrium microscopicum]|uniref:Uncharacterized protein n=1 Tax=Microthyrium microscopicum TaxID=703497 RepID=A0A6A6UJA3_9PEZI|nr:hypothetical protein BT63DRAFT_209510 [Microthyrium microscopicum]